MKTREGLVDRQHSVYRRRMHIEKRPRPRVRNEERFIERTERYAALLRELAVGPCSDCGERYPPNWMAVTSQVDCRTVPLRRLRSALKGAEVLCPSCRQERRRHQRATAATRDGLAVS